MSPATNFFICACAILVFTIINVSIGPMINKYNSNWALANCAKLEDEYESDKKDNPNMDDDTKEEKEIEIRECKNKKAMHNMEYTSCIFNVVISFICILLGIHGLQKEVIPKTGMIGMGCGVVGFILTFVYVIYNGVVSTNYHPPSSSSYNTCYKTDGDGAFAELDGNYYKCFYFNKKGDTDAIIAKYVDLVKSQYNYNKDLDDEFKKEGLKKSCEATKDTVLSCAKDEYITSTKKHDGKQCPYLYYHYGYTDYNNRDIGSRFLTLLILSIFILLCYCGLIFSGFMIMKETS